MSSTRALSISVLVPVHNGATHLRPTIDALLAQTFSEFELLCIDDGSTDDSFEVLSEYKDPRMRVLRQPQAGLCKTLNLGLAEAGGDYIARNDQDDVSLPNRLEKQRDFLERHPEVGCLFSTYVKAGAAKSRSEKIEPQAAETFCLERGVPQTCQLGSSMMARRNVLRSVGGYRADYYPADDWDLQLRLTEKWEVRVLHEPLVSYRYHLGANTYPTFRRSMQNGRWAWCNHVRRLVGKGELSRDEYLQQNESSLVQTLRHSLVGLARLNMRKASQADLDGFPVKAALYAMWAGLCDPWFVVGRAWFNLSRSMNK